MNLRKLRKSKHMTMKQLADMVGVTESAIGLYETGKRNPSYEMLLRLSEALGCSVDDIVRENEKRPSEEDELVKDLQMLRDDPKFRAVLRSKRSLTDDQWDIVLNLIEGLRKSNETGD